MGLVVIITILGNTIINVINSTKTTRVEAKTDQQTQVLSEIKTQTDGTLSTIIAEATAAKQRADALQLVLDALINRNRTTDNGLNGVVK